MYVGQSFKQVDESTRMGAPVSLTLRVDAQPFQAPGVYMDYNTQ